MITVHGPIILDLNTQRDLLTADGTYPLVHFEKVADGLKKVFTSAQRLRVPVISTRLRHVLAPTPGAQPGQSLSQAIRLNQKLVCSPSTVGYQKLPATLLRKRKEMPMDCDTNLPVEGFKVTQQFIFDLPGLNPFECPRLDRLMSEAEVGLWVIVGGPMEWTLRTAVLGLLQRRQKVAVISDAIGKWDPYEGDMALRQIESKNIEWMTAAEAGERFARPAPVRSLAAQLAHPTTQTGHAAPATKPAPAPIAQPARKSHASARRAATAKRPAARGKTPSRQFRMS